jgi:hypothetical protein
VYCSVAVYAHWEWRFGSRYSQRAAAMTERWGPIGGLRLCANTSTA